MNCPLPTTGRASAIASGPAPIPALRLAAPLIMWTALRGSHSVIWFCA